MFPKVKFINIPTVEKISQPLCFCKIFLYQIMNNP